MCKIQVFFTVVLTEIHFLTGVLSVNIVLVFLITAVVAAVVGGEGAIEVVMVAFFLTLRDFLGRFRDSFPACFFFF